MNQTEEKETDELELLTLTELSKTLKLNKATIRKHLMETKLLPYVKISRKLIRFMRNDVEEFLLSKKGHTSLEEEKCLRFKSLSCKILRMKG